MRHVPVVAVLLAACGGSQAHQDPVRDLTKYLPATFDVEHPKDGEPRALHVRVWADQAVRAAPHWREDLTDDLDTANQLLQPAFGAKLVVDDIKDWNRAGDPHGALAALADADPGKDVAWVIGYVAPNATASHEMAELGDAKVLGHHVVVHAWAEQAETAALAPKLAGLTAGERTEVLGSHKRHKQAVVLLHELGTTAGAIPDTETTWIMHPTYSTEQAGFAERNRDLVQLAIDERLGGSAEADLAHDLLESILAQDWGGWIPAERETVVAALRLAVEAGKSGKTATDIPAAAADQYDRVLDLKKRGETAEGLRELENLIVAYPTNATLYELKCELMIDKPGVQDQTTRAACAHTAELAPGDPTVHFAVGEALAKTGDLAGARAELADAAARIPNLKSNQEDAWRRLATIYAQMGALTWTEEAIAAGGPQLASDPAAAQVAQTRARFGLPRGGKLVKPEDEAALVAAVRAALDELYAGKYGAAEHDLATAERRWRGAAGIDAARCDLELHRGAIAAARAACARSLAADPGESWALYLAGVLALRDASGTKAGIEHLKKAIAVDPDLAQAWRALAKAYDRAHDRAALDALSNAYQAKFGQSLPP